MSADLLTAALADALQDAADCWWWEHHRDRYATPVQRAAAWLDAEATRLAQQSVEPLPDGCCPQCGSTDTARCGVDSGVELWVCHTCGCTT